MLVTSRLLGRMIVCIAERCFDGSHGIYPVDPAVTIRFVAERRLKPVPAISFKRRSATIRFGNLVVYVCSPLSSATNGVAHRVDGGVVRACF
jgi:hypothetical protein